MIFSFSFRMPGILFFEGKTARWKWLFFSVWNFVSVFIFSDKSKMWNLLLLIQFIHWDPPTARRTHDLSATSHGPCSVLSARGFILTPNISLDKKNTMRRERKRGEGCLDWAIWRLVIQSRGVDQPSLFTHGNLPLSSVAWAREPRGFPGGVQKTKKRQATTY